MRPPVLAAALLAVTSLACSPRQGPVPGPLSEAALARALGVTPGASADLLAQGRQLFVDRCDGCHGYPDIWFYEEKKWPGILKSMAEKAELTAAERDLALNFILAAKSDAPPTAAPGGSAPAPK